MRSENVTGELIYGTHSTQVYANRGRILAATRLLMFKTKGVLPRLFLAFFLVALLLVSLMLLVGAELPLWFMTAIIVLVGAALYYRLMIDHPRRFFRGDPKFHDEYLLTFSEEGVACKTTKIDIP